jgi:hypothetical protein
VSAAGVAAPAGAVMGLAHWAAFVDPSRATGGCLAARTRRDGIAPNPPNTPEVKLPHRPVSR